MNEKMSIEVESGVAEDMIRDEENNRSKTSIMLNPSSVRRINQADSAIETLARSIDFQREHRMKVTFSQRKKFLAICEEEAEKEGGNPSRLSKERVEQLVQEYELKVKKKSKMRSRCDNLMHVCGIWNSDEAMSALFHNGLEYIVEVEDTELHFRDFSFYNTVLVSKFALMQYGVFFIAFWLLMFYLGSAVLFCHIMSNENVCPKDVSLSEGWISSIYFASITMSTVGYGDISLYEEGQSQWITLIATLYILFSMAVAFTVFTSVASFAFDGIFSNSRFKPALEDSKDEHLYKIVRRLVIIRVVEMLTFFVVLNAIGSLAALGFANVWGENDKEWDWMTSVYWAVQTTTTVGYGDVDMPHDLRLFNIFFSTFGTAFVGSVFGTLAGLRGELDDHRNYHAWMRRDLSKRMISEILITDDDKLDQSEFVLGSLLLLGKVKTKDIDQIMKKFRMLAGEGKTYITIADFNNNASNSMDPKAFGRSNE